MSSQVGISHTSFAPTTRLSQGVLHLRVFLAAIVLLADRQTVAVGRAVLAVVLAGLDAIGNADVVQTAEDLYIS